MSTITPPASGVVDDFDAITRVLTTLLEGESAGDVAKLQSAFHADARMFGQVQGQRCDMPIADYFAYAAEAPGNSHGNYAARVLSVQHTGDAAIAVVVEENCWGSACFIDYFALARMAGTWKVVNKTFALTAGEMPG